MSHRPVQAKKIAKLRKLLRRELPAFIDPVEFIVSRGHARTKREARLLILGGKLRSESHKVGYGEYTIRGKDGKPEAVPVVIAVPAHLRDTLTVQT
jgi:hypothetical protein